MFLVASRLSPECSPNESQQTDKNKNVEDLNLISPARPNESHKVEQQTVCQRLDEE